MKTNLVKVSKFLSLVLRHEPEKIGLSLNENGWAKIDDLLILANEKGTSLTHSLLDQIVAENDKKRFEISEDGLRIRACQGHSIDVDLALTPVQPPEVLYHGTASRFVDSIRTGGLHSANRQHVHLSLDMDTARRVGQRHGNPVVLMIRSEAMAAAGHSFFLSTNGVWLTEQVPVEFIRFPS